MKEKHIDDYREIAIDAGKKIRQKIDWGKEEKKAKQNMERYAEDKEEKAKKEAIWLEDEKGKRKLQYGIAAEILVNEFNFITVGKEKLDIYYYEDGVYLPRGKHMIATRMQELTEGRIFKTQISEIVGHIERMTYQREELEEVDPRYICVLNGIYDLETKEMIEHNKDIKFIQKIPYNYRPEVAAKCPKILEFLSQILDEKDVVVLQEFLGFILYRKYLLKKALILVGEKDSGKTTLIRLIVKLIGQPNTAGISLHRLINARFSSAILKGKLLNFYDDLPFEDLNDTGTFKIATGGGYMSAEKKFGDTFEFMNYAKLLFATNKISGTKDVDDEAYYDRWLIMFFNQCFSGKKKDPRLIEKITTLSEMEGLLAWAIQGLHRILENEDFNYYRSVEENKNVMERSSNTVAAFVQDCLTNSQDRWISKQMLYSMYGHYVDVTGGAKVSIEKFGRDLPKKALWLSSGRKEGNTCWNNVSISEQAFHTFFKLLYNYNINTFYIKQECRNSMKSMQISDYPLPLVEEKCEKHAEEENEKKYVKCATKLINKTDELLKFVENNRNQNEGLGVKEQEIYENASLEVREKLPKWLKYLEMNGVLFRTKPDIWNSNI